MAKKKEKKSFNNSKKETNTNKIKKENKSKESKFENLDLKALIQNKSFKKIIPFIFILIIIFVAFYVRSGPITLNGLDENIKANILNNIKLNIQNQINQKYPNLNDIYKQDLINKEYQKVLDSGEINMGNQIYKIDDLVKQNSKTIKDSFKAENGQTYLNAIDPYHFLRVSELYNLNGYVGDKIKIINGKEVPWISYKLAPIGKEGSFNPGFHVWLETFLFKLNGIGEKSTIGEETKVVYLIPVFFAILAGITSFLVLRLFTNDISALFGSLLLVSIGTFVSRTVAGFVDTDAYNVFFPLLIILFLIYGFLFKDVFKTILFSSLAGLSQGLFLWAWSAGWFIFIIIIFSLLSYLLYIFILNILRKVKLNLLFNNIKNDLYVLFSFLFSSIVFSYIFSQSNIIKITLDGIYMSITNLTSISNNIWPNVESSIAELNPTTIPSIIAAVGGKPFFLFAMFGVLFLLLDFKSNNKNDKLIRKFFYIFSFIWFISMIYNNAFIFLTANSPIIYLILLFLPIFFGGIYSLYSKNLSTKVFFAIILSVWMGGTIYMSLNGVRFILLLAPAFALAFGVGLYYLMKIINNFISSEFTLKKDFSKKVIGNITIIIIFLVLYTPVFNQANTISKGTIPNFDDSWYEGMYKIKNETKSNAIITSWWDFGHFFTTVSKRGVTFDGGSQTTPASHWVGKLLMENDENKSVDILKMLVCGNNMAFDKFYEFVGNSSADAVKINKILYQTFGNSKEETINILRNNKYYNLSESQIEEIMKYLKCDNPPESLLITSGDMIGKAGVWAHWGSWDFTKKYVYDNYKSLDVETIAKNIDENESLIKKYVSELKDIDYQAKTQDLKRTDLINRWLADYPSYVPIQGRYKFNCVPKNSTLICENSFKINLETGEVSSQFGKDIKFNALYYPSFNNTIGSFDLGTGDLDIVLLPSQAGYSVMMTQKTLGNSLFTKLFFMNGFGTNKFINFYDEQGATGNRIIIWKVKFD